MMEQQPARAAPGKRVIPPQSDYLGGTEMTVSDAPQIASVLLMLARWVTRKAVAPRWTG